MYFPCNLNDCNNIFNVKISARVILLAILLAFPGLMHQQTCIVTVVLLCVFSRDRSKARKQARRMVCDCVLPQPDELKGGMQPCGDDCLNRLLMIEW